MPARTTIAGSTKWMRSFLPRRHDRSLAARAGPELEERGAYADGVTKGAVDAYLRAARAFGLLTDAEIIQLIPARFLERPG